MIGLEEAIKLISPATEGAAYIKIRDEHGQEATHNQAEMAKILAVECMEKQIAKPPAQVEDDDELCVRYECPACGSSWCRGERTKSYGSCTGRGFATADRGWIGARKDDRKRILRGFFQK